MSWLSAIERTVQGLGYEMVDAERTAGGLLRVTIDRVPGHEYRTGPGEQVTVEDCEVVTRQLQYLLEVEAVDYARLEVSSPGLDRPLRKPADWARFVGCDVELTLRAPFQGRKRFTGQLVGREGGYTLLLAPPETPGPKKGKKPVAAPPAPQQGLDFSLDEVREARLVPVIDFKGRRAAAGGAGGSHDATHNEDGAQNR